MVMAVPSRVVVAVCHGHRAENRWSACRKGSEAFAKKFVSRVSEGVQRVFAAATKRFLESGCALIVGTVNADGEPHANRGWGLTVLPGDGDHIRLLLDADDPRALADLTAAGAIAITGADVRTLQSVQLKGRFVGSEPADDDDRARVRRFCDGFFGDVVAVDGTPRELLERLVPDDYVACTIAIGEVYDQTPGPGAGAPLAQGTA
jgi:hypothetical protein